MLQDRSKAWLKAEQWQDRKIPLYYVLDQHTPIPSNDIGEFVRLYDDFSARKVEQTTVGQSFVSTIFSGVNIGLSETPKLFQTEVFGGRMDETQWLSATWEEAAATHQAIVDVLTSELETHYQRDFYILSFGMAIAMLVFQIVR